MDKEGYYYTSCDAPYAITINYFTSLMDVRLFSITCSTGLQIRRNEQTQVERKTHKPWENTGKSMVFERHRMRPEMWSEIGKLKFFS